MSPEQDPGDRHFHELFATLRDQVAEVAHDFADRVAHSVERYEGERTRSPSSSGILASLVAQTGNILNRLLRDPDADDPE